MKAQFKSRMRENDMKKAKYVWQRSICLLSLLLMLVGLAACSNSKDPLKAPLEVENMQKTVAVQTHYGPIRFPEVLAGNMRHAETVEGDIALEIFYMVLDAGEREVFRIYFGSSGMGEHLGYLNTEAGEIPVTFALCEYADEDFTLEEERILYSNMMTAFTVVSNSIQSDERFSELRTMEQVGEQGAQMRFWSLTLPDNVMWEESETNGIYRVDFYGMIEDKRIDLYYVGLGEMEADTKLGYFTVDGVQMPIMVGNSELVAYESWSKEDQRVIYDMMDSINLVIQQIVACDQYSDHAE